MEIVQIDDLQKELDTFSGREVFIHLETTNGSYAAHYDTNFFNAGAFIRNVKLVYEHAKVIEDTPNRVGLKLPHGWVYAQGITHYEVDAEGRLLMAGLDHSGKLAVALQISETPFSY